MTKVLEWHCAPHSHPEHSGRSSAPHDDVSVPSERVLSGPSAEQDSLTLSGPILGGWSGGGQTGLFDLLFSRFLLLSWFDHLILRPESPYHQQRKGTVKHVGRRQDGVVNYGQEPYAACNTS